MQFTPSQAAAHLKESIASYIESQYRISHPLVYAEMSPETDQGAGARSRAVRNILNEPRVGYRMARGEQTSSEPPAIA